MKTATRKPKTQVRTLRIVREVETPTLRIVDVIIARGNTTDDYRAKLWNDGEARFAHAEDQTRRYSCRPAAGECSCPAGIYAKRTMCVHVACARKLASL